MISRLSHTTGSHALVPPVAADQKARLRGFSMLVALGDQQAAMDAWWSALDAARRRRQPIAHQAGWLRRRVARRLGHGLREHIERMMPAAHEELDVERRATLRAFGASDGVISGLRALSVEQRAALVAHEIEHLETDDLAALLGRRNAAAQRFLARAVRGYLRGAEPVLAEEPWARRQQTGDIARRVAAAADPPAGLEAGSR
jgi:DNA-directed RNA polymerase specialized sigma24 family protein